MSMKMLTRVKFSVNCWLTLSLMILRDVYKMEIQAALRRLESNLKTFLYESDDAYIRNLLSMGRSEVEANRLACWDWPHGVGLYGMYKQYLLTKDAAILDVLEHWYDTRIAFGLPQKTVNTVAPLLTLAFLYEKRPKQAYRTILLQWGEWIMNEMVRTVEAGLQHRHAELENPGELWDDTLFMTVLFLAKAGTVFDIPSYREEAKYQVLLHITYLLDTKTSLYFHAWSFERNDNFARALWGRGNGWITMFIPEFLDILSCDEATERFLRTRLVRQLQSLCKYQDASGLWHTLIDDESSYLEASGSAGFCYGLYKAIGKGYVDSSYLPHARKALQALLERIDAQGRLGDVSYGTNVGKDLEHYRSIRLQTMQYGQGMAMLALVEALQEAQAGIL